MENITYIKGIIAAVAAFFSAKLGILGPILVALMGVMVVDYLTGMTASKKEGSIDSKKGMWGILKKVTYMIVVGVGMLMDWLILTTAESLGAEIPLQTFFGLLVAIWLIINELISILENLTRIGTPMPDFLVRLVKSFKVSVENSADKLADVVEQNKDDQEGEGHGKI